MNRVYGAIGGLVIGVIAGIAAIWWLQLGHLSLISQIGMCAGLGGLGAALGGIFGVQLY